MTIHWYTPPDSEAIERAGYDPDRHELHVVFAGGRRYRYDDAPPDLFARLKRAPSAGQFVNWEVKPHYRFEEAKSWH